MKLKKRLHRKMGPFLFAFLIWSINGLNYIPFLFQRLVEFPGMGAERVGQGAELFDIAFDGVGGL